MDLAVRLSLVVEVVSSRERHATYLVRRKHSRYCGGTGGGEALIVVTAQECCEVHVRVWTDVPVMAQQTGVVGTHTNE